MSVKGICRPCMIVVILLAQNRSTCPPRSVWINDFFLTEHFCHDGYSNVSFLFQDDNALTHRAWGVTKWFHEYEKGWKWITYYGRHIHKITAQLNTCGRFWTTVFNGFLYQDTQNTKQSSIFWFIFFFIFLQLFNRIWLNSVLAC